MSNNPYQLITDMALHSAVMSAILHNADAFSLMTEAVYSDNRCRVCGYRRNHPIVMHVYPWNGHAK
jgi:hypothetical protein